APTSTLLYTLSLHDALPIWFHAKTVTDVRHKVEDDVKLLLDIFVAGGAMRFQMEADTFPFKYCFDRPDLNLPQKLGLLIELFAQNAPQAIMNHGANALRQGAPGNAAYASKAEIGRAHV